ncbi:hypothetical protein QYM36_011368 [Artemia franciscana]|uniref:Uncharacterized protein n=1 Tax=Artemia franciscana TaxID=6661 RepID=A0AA88HK06_ARTSF|nr:hypothetical protein QYM36_011368 [Artemia franciscana]
MQNVEQMWRDFHQAIPRYGRNTKHMAGNLAEFFFRQRYPEHMDRLHYFLEACSKVYLSPKCGLASDSQHGTE